MKYGVIKKIKQIIELEPKSFYKGFFVLSCIEEIEELRDLFKEAKVRRWIREGNTKEAIKWINKMKEKLGE